MDDLGVYVHGLSLMYELTIASDKRFLVTDINSNEEVNLFIFLDDIEGIFGISDDIMKYKIFDAWVDFNTNKLDKIIDDVKELYN